MLEALLESLNTGEFDDEGVVRICSVEHAGGDIDLRLETGFDGESSFQTWLVRCATVQDFCLLRRDWEPLELVTAQSHPAIRQHVDDHGDLIFTGACSDVAAVIGRLWAAHDKVAEGWIPFERYLNRLVTFDQILACGHGKLASGPVFLLDAYAEVLRSAGCSISPFLEHPPRVFEDGAWRTQSERLAMLRLGSSFVVAEKFVLRHDG